MLWTTLSCFGTNLFNPAADRSSILCIGKSGNVPLIGISGFEVIAHFAQDKAQVAHEFRVISAKLDGSLQFDASIFETLLFDKDHGQVVDGNHVVGVFVKTSPEAGDG